MGKLVVGELTMERALEALEGERADIVYCDPPWGPGLLRYFRTLNGEPDADPSWPEFLELLAQVIVGCVAPGGHIFIEMGEQWADELAAAMAAAGAPESGRWTCYYSSPKRPQVVWYSGPGTTTDPSGLSGVKMTHTALAGVARLGALVFDPCCGKGMTAKCALRLGMRFAGVELNPARARVTQDILERWRRR